MTADAVIDRFFDAICDGKKDVVEAVIAEHGVDVVLDWTDGMRDTPLTNAYSYAIREESGNTEIVELLLRHGACPNQRTPLGQPLLNLQTQNVALYELLLAHGADPEGKSPLGWTALMMAARAHNQVALNVLLKHGANPNVSDSEGMTPLMHAAHEGDEGGLRLLLDHGADMNARDSKGRTALSIMAELDSVHGREITAIKYLLNRGCDVDTRNSDGMTPLEAAEHAGCEAAADVIRSFIEAAQSAEERQAMSMIRSIRQANRRVRMIRRSA